MKNSYIQPKGIGGWLILVIIGLVINPITTVYFLTNSVWPIFQNGTWSMLTTPGGDAYHALWAPLIVFEVLSNLIVLVLGLMTLWCLVKKSKRTPMLAIAWIFWSAAFMAIDLYVVNLIPLMATQSHTNAVYELTRAVISAGIWIPYFLVSKRVKATFVE